MLVFEVGKYYKHTAGKTMAIVGEVTTDMWGVTLVAESCSNTMTELVPVGKNEDAAVNWSEILRDEWMKNFTND